MLLDDGNGQQRAVEFVGVGAVFLTQKHGGSEVGEGAIEVVLVEVHLAAVLAGIGGEAAPLVHLGVEYAMRQLARGLYELALKLQDLRPTDATGHRLFPVAGEARLAHGLVGHFPGFIEPADEAQQGDLFVQRGQAAQGAEFFKPLTGGLKVYFFAQGDGVVTDDETQGVFL